MQVIRIDKGFAHQKLPLLSKYFHIEYIKCFFIINNNNLFSPDLSCTFFITAIAMPFTLTG